METVAALTVKTVVILIWAVIVVEIGGLPLVLDLDVGAALSSEGGLTAG